MRSENRKAAISQFQALLIPGPTAASMALQQQIERAKRMSCENRDACFQLTYQISLATMGAGRCAWTSYHRSSRTFHRSRRDPWCELNPGHDASTSQRSCFSCLQEFRPRMTAMADSGAVGARVAAVVDVAEELGQLRCVCALATASHPLGPRNFGAGPIACFC